MFTHQTGQGPARSGRFCSRKNKQTTDNLRLSGGFPHSDIPGSKGALASPGLIAECHVLHRLLLPRHPPNALIALDPIQKTTGPFARGWFNLNPSVMSPVGSLDPSASPRQETRRSRALNGRQTRQDPRSVSFDLERLLSSQRTSRGPPRGIRPTRRTPEQRLVYCSLHDVSISSSRSRDRTGRLIPDEPANQISRWPVARLLETEDAGGDAGGACRDRTDDPLLAKQVLSQLS